MDEEASALLREIRDGQKLHLANYKEAVANQQSSIELQRRSVRFSQRALVGLILLVLVIFAFSLVPRLFRSVRARKLC